VDARYSAVLHTIITTGLRPVEFRKRYGDACWRRLTEQGIGSHVTTWPREKP
jgi:hypothetical protein